MKKVLLLSLGILLCANVAFGQAGAIGLYSEPTYTSCDLADVAPGGLATVYVVHKLTPGATAAQFMLQTTGNLCTYLAEAVPPPLIAIGTLFPNPNGVSIAYGGCLVADILVATISYFCAGATPPCGEIVVVPDPASPTGTIEIVDCAQNKLIGTGSKLTINGDASCPCGLPTQETSWGQIKSMY